MHSTLRDAIPKNWLEKDQKVIWHPFSQAGLDPAPILFSHGKGAVLFTETGDSYVDGISSWWVNLHGHGCPSIAKAIYEQCLTLEHVIFTDFTHRPAIELAELLLQHLPPSLEKIFFSDNGSTSVEVALKMAIQYWHNQKKERKKILCLKNGYHGDTFGAMAVSSKCSLHAPFWPFLFEVISIDPPFLGKEEASLEQCKKALLSDDIACFIFEPVIQGAGGMQIYSKNGLDALCNICKQKDVLLIADEVMTGFGRTGPLFISNELEIVPDILCLSKGITGGFLPLGATVVQQHVRNAFYGKTRKEAFLHAHSYTGNPIACAAACASLKLLVSPLCQQQRQNIQKAHANFCQKWQSHPKVCRLETLGTLLICEFRGQEGYFSSMRDFLNSFFLNEKILVRPLGNVLYVMPPYCITHEELDQIYTSIAKLLETT